MENINIESFKELITLPENAGLREAYFALLKELYATGKDSFWISEIISIISLDCGVTIDTAKDRAKQLVRFNLLKFLSSSFSGHRYLVQVYSAIDNGDPVLIDDWDKFNRLLTKQFGGIVEPGLTKIRRSVNTQGKPMVRDTVEAQKARSDLALLDTAKPIIIGNDCIKSVFKTLNKMSKKDLIQQIEDNNSDSTVKSAVLGEE